MSGSRRYNRKAVIISVVVLILIPILVIGLNRWQVSRLRRDAFAMVEKLEGQGKIEVASRHLAQYLERWPEDVEALEIAARLFDRSARDLDHLMAATRTLDRLIKLDPDGEGRQESRRRLAENYLLYSDLYRMSPAFQRAPELGILELRYQAAEAVARQIVRRDPDDAAGHRLLGQALEGSASGGNAEQVAAAIEAYRTALKLEPGDLVAGERLANLLHDQRKDPVAAERVLACLLRDQPDRAEARLVRARYFDRAGRRDEAAAERAEAVRLAPEDLEVRLAVAGDLLRRGAPGEARRQVEALPEAARGDLRVQLLLGLVSFGERQPDRAIEIWRSELSRHSGSDAELLWWLSYVLLQSGRVAEAAPLVERYASTAEGDSDPMLLFLRALLDEQRNRPLRAIEALEKIRDRVVEDRRALAELALGRCYEASWQQDRALAAFRRAAALAPASPEPLIAEARILGRNRPADAIAAVERAARAEAAEPAILTARARDLIAAQRALPPARRSWAELEDVIRRIEALSPENPSLGLIRADRRLLEGDPEGAVAVLEAHTGRHPRDPSGWVALANAHERVGRLDRALEVLDRAARPEAIGDRAVLRITRARVLTGLGRGREGRAQLVRDEAALPPGDRPGVWETCGNLLAAYGDTAGALRAYSEWARLEPESPAPLLAQFDLTVAGEDEAALRQVVDAIRDLRGPDDSIWRLCRALTLLREPAAGAAPAPDPARLTEAQALLKDLRNALPESPVVALLRGRLSERLGEVEPSIRDYRLAWERGLDVALPRLVGALARAGRTDDLAQLRREAPAAEVDRHAAAAYLEVGDAAGAAGVALPAGDARGIDTRDVPWRARVLAASGKLDEAEKLLRAAAESSRGDSEGPAWLALLRFLAANGRTQAIPVAIAQMKARAKSTDLALVDAFAAWASRDWAAADRGFAAALQRNPDRLDVHFAAAQYHEERGRPLEAIARLRRVLELDTEGRRPAAHHLAILLAAQGDPDAWREAWQIVGGDADPASTAAAEPRERLARALVLARSTDLDRRRTAIEPLRELIEDLPPGDPMIATAADDLIGLLVREGPPDRAAAVAEEQARRSGDPASIARHIGLAIQAGDHSTAGRQLDRLEALAPLDPRAIALRVRLAAAEAGPERAVEAITLLVDSTGDGPRALAVGREAFTALFAMASTVGDPADDAAARVAQALALADPALSWTLARSLARQGFPAESLEQARTAIAHPASTPADIEEAARAAMEAVAETRDPALRDRAAGLLRAAVERQPRSTAVLTLAGLLAHAQARYEDEARFFRQVLAIDPADPLALNNLAWVLAEDLDRPAEALPLIEQLAGAARPTPQVLSTRGVVRLRAGKPAEAIADLTAAAGDEPGALNHYYRALAHHRAGDREAARRHLDAAHQAGLTIEAIEPPRRPEYQALLKPGG